MTDFVKDYGEDRILSNLKTLMAPFDLSEDFSFPEKPLNYYSNIEYFELKTSESCMQ